MFRLLSNKIHFFPYNLTLFSQILLFIVSHVNIKLIISLKLPLSGINLLRQQIVYLCDHYVWL